MRGEEATKISNNASMTLCMPLSTGTNDQMTAHEYGVYRPFSILRAHILSRDTYGAQDNFAFCIEYK